MNVTLYSKRNCHLCDVLKADLLAMQQEFGFVLCEVDSDDDQEANTRFQHLIPVLDIEGGPLLYAPISYDELFDALEIGTMNRRISDSDDA